MKRKLYVFGDWPAMPILFERIVEEKLIKKAGIKIVDAEAK